MVCTFKHAKEMWDRLIEAYEQHSSASKVVLQRQFFEANMKENESVVVFLSRVQRLANQLTEAGVKMGEETLVGRIVAGLTPKFHVFITNWSNNTATKQTMAELVPRLTAEESLLQGFDKTSRQSNPTAMISDSKSVPQTSRPKPPNHKRIKCTNCGKIGHTMKNCRSKRSDNKSTGRKQETMVVEGIVTETSGSASFEALLAVSCEAWILDSGASDHMSYDRSSFENFKTFQTPRKVKLGDYNETEAIGFGDIRMVAELKGSRDQFILKKVLYVPGIRRKLISLGSATSKGLLGQISSEGITLNRKDGTVFMTAVKQGSL